MADSAPVFLERSIGADMKFFSQLFAALLLGGRFATRYRPEDHYMRGPGPKWRAKHASNA